MSARAWAIVGVAVVLVALLYAIGRDREGDVTRSDEIRSDSLIAQLQQRGYEVREAKAYRDLLAYLKEMEDSTSLLNKSRAELAQKVEVLGGQVRAAANLRARVDTVLQLVGEEHADSVGGADSVTWAYRDSTFALDATYRPPDTLAVALGARVAIALAWIETPDRRLIATAHPTDSRVQIELSEVAYQLPEVRGACDFWCRRGLEARGGAVVLVIVGALAAIR